MQKGILTVGFVALMVTACSGLPSFDGNRVKYAKSDASYTSFSAPAKQQDYYVVNSKGRSNYVDESYDSPVASQVTAPKQCFLPEDQTGLPINYHQGSIIDQPVLVERKALKVPSSPVAQRNFFCAAFHYAIDKRGRVSDVFTLYNSHPGLQGLDFARDAEKALKKWRYQPGMVDKAPAKYTGLTTVFYYSFDG